MNENIIDTSLERFKNIPITLNGEVLLEMTRDRQDNLSGYLTCPIETIEEMKDLTDEELEDNGWIKYKHILNSFT